MLLFFLALAPLYKLMSILSHIFVLPLLGLLSGVKPHLKIACIGYSVLGEPQGRYGIVFSLGPFYINKANFVVPVFC